MENFTFYAPTYFVFKKETEKEAGKCIKKFGDKYTDNTFKKIKHIDEHGN